MFAKLYCFFLVGSYHFFFSFAEVDDMFVIGEQGESCAAACGNIGRSCMHNGIPGTGITEIFKQLGITCNTSDSTSAWWAPDQPSYVSDEADKNYGLCVGVTDIPKEQGSFCQFSEFAVKRLCHCGQDVTNKLTFGTGLSGGTLSQREETIFAHKLNSDDSKSFGLMEHFWTTCSPDCMKNSIFRYYIDGEANASIAFTPSLAAGVGFDDSSNAPWGLKWFGLGAGKSGGQAWYHNIKVPFHTHVRITVQSTSSSDYGGFYTIVRGSLHQEDSFKIGDTKVPSEAKLLLQQFNGSLDPLEYLDIVNVEEGFSGLHFLSTLAVANDGVGGLNFLEGCYHLYSPPSEAFPGTLLSTGTEDYFDSGWYFNSGEFELPVSGFTHIKQDKTVTEWSAYRFHEMDPIVFQNGMRMVWRCGDATSGVTHLKCFTETGGNVVGKPTCSNVRSYAWVYVWKNSD